MKKQVLFVALAMSLGFISCKKCQTCTTDTTQNVMGYDQTTSSSQEYCGDDYDDAPAEGTYSQTVGSINQQVTIACQDN